MWNGAFAVPAIDEIRRALAGQAVRAAEWRFEEGRARVCLTEGAPLARPEPLPDRDGLFAAVTDGAEYPYLLFLPRTYDPTRPCRTMLFLHGIGERGRNPRVLANFGPFQYILDGHADFPWIVIAPQLEENDHWTEGADGAEEDDQMIRLLRFLEQMRAAYAVDPGRLCLTGLSMGGKGGFKLCCFAPGLFSAAALCCGRASPRNEPEAFLYPMDRMAGLPLWLFHGTEDATVAPAHSISALNRLNRLDPAADRRLTLYPGVAHGSFHIAYRDGRLYGWLRSYTDRKEGIL